MKNHVYLLLIILMVFVWSCKKDSLLPETHQDDSSAFVSTIGAYWIYEIVQIDYDGTETLSSVKDTIRIIGDTMINGNTYAILYGTLMGGNPGSVFHRDSAGYVVNNHGAIVYSFNHFGDTLHSTSDFAFDYHTYMINELATEFTVPAGSFVNVLRQTDMYKSNGEPIDTCGNAFYAMQNRYAPEIGLIYKTCPYFYEMETCRDREWRLIEYYIP
jgi:hypothetical protein